MRDPVLSEHDQWQLQFHTGASSSEQHATGFGHFKEQYKTLTESIDSFFSCKLGLTRQGRTTYTLSDSSPQLFNPASQIFLFCHNGSGLALLSHLIGIPLSLVYTSFYFQPSSFTTILFEERATHVYAPRVLALGETSHFERSREKLGKKVTTVNNKYEKCTSGE